MRPDPGADKRAAPHETTAGIVAFDGRARAAADQVIDELNVDHVGTAWFGDTVSIRWVLIHMIEETARHAGHMDIVRELIDGMTGDHRTDAADHADVGVRQPHRRDRGRPPR